MKGGMEARSAVDDKGASPPAASSSIEIILESKKQDIQGAKLTVDEFKVWAPLYDLMSLRCGLPLLRYQLMLLRCGLPFNTIS